jgi:hypothetical protein
MNIYFPLLCLRFILLRMPFYLIFQLTSYKVARWPNHLLVIGPQGLFFRMTLVLKHKMLDALWYWPYLQFVHVLKYLTELQPWIWTLDWSLKAYWSCSHSTTPLAHLILHFASSVIDLFFVALLGFLHQQLGYIQDFTTRTWVSYLTKNWQTTVNCLVN